MSQNKILRKKLLRISNNLIGNVTDFILFSIFYGINIVPGRTGYFGDIKAGEEADRSLIDINFKTIKRSFYELKRRGLINFVKRDLLKAEKISNDGREKLETIIPVYQEKRTWDKRIYLVTYDIPTKKNWQRNQLRTFLKKLGCGYLQHSVWLTVYNPKALIKEFIESRKITGQILVSDLGPDGNIGGKDIKTLVEDVYDLVTLNDEYKIFMEQAKKTNRNNKNAKQQLIFSYLSILNNDPQLPFELLPDNWVGDEAYLIFKTLF